MATGTDVGLEAATVSECIEHFSDPQETREIVEACCAASDLYFMCDG